MKTIIMKTKNILKIGVFSIVILSLLISPILKSNTVHVNAASTCEARGGICVTSTTECKDLGKFNKSLNSYEYIDSGLSCTGSGKTKCCMSIYAVLGFATNSTVSNTILESSAVDICDDAFPKGMNNWAIFTSDSDEVVQHAVCVFQIGTIEGLGKMFNATINWGISMILWAIEPATFGGFVKNTGVTDVGKIIRNFVNLFLILGLVFIAIATILGIKKYSWQQLLWKLIVVALLVNFSVIISGMILDISQFFTYNFLKLAEGGKDISVAIKEGFHASSTMDDLTHYGLFGTEAVSVVKTAAYYSTASIYIPAETTVKLKSGWGLSWGNFFITVIGMILIGLFAVIALLAVFVTMMLRACLLIILLCLSPIAFAAWIFPDTEKYWKMWWEQFIKWCTFPVIFSLMLYMGIIVMNGLFAKIGTGEAAKLGMIAFSIQMFLFSMFLVAGLLISVQGGGAAAQFVMKQGSKLGLAAGAAVGGFTLGRIVNSGWYNKIAEKLSAKEGKLGEKPILGAITRPISSQLYKLRATVSATQAKKDEEALKAISGEKNALTNYVISARRLGKTTSVLKALKIKADNEFEFTDTEKQFMLQLPEIFRGTEEARRIYKYNPALRIDKQTGKPITAEQTAIRYNLSPSGEANVQEVIETLGVEAKNFLADKNYGALTTARTITQIAKFIQGIPTSDLKKTLENIARNILGTTGNPVSLHDWLQANNSSVAKFIETPPLGGRESALAANIKAVWNTK